MKYKSILITGGAGFIGSNLAVRFKEKYPKLKIIALDNLKRRGSEMNLGRLRDYGIRFIHGDIRNPEDLDLDTGFELLIECSAEPSVLAGFKEKPAYIINTNLSGTVNCLESARRNKAAIIFLSTSRVYPYQAINDIKTIELPARFDWKKAQKITGWSQEGIAEGFSLSGPRTLYGATKLAAELILEEYLCLYGLKGLINRCGVIAGPWQFGKIDQGVFTFWMLAHYFRKEINYIGFAGSGKQVRDLLHIDDLFSLIDLEAANLDRLNGRVYNVGGGRKVNLSLAETSRLCAEITGRQIKIGRCQSNRPADLKIYISDNSKVKEDLAWVPKKTAKDILLDIYQWICDNQDAIRENLICSGK